VPENPLKKFSVVDVRCTDSYKRQFIVEMQMEWSTAFPSRMLYNTSKAYVRQLDAGENYATLHPVYGLGILTEAFDHKTDEFYHHYQMLNAKNTDEAIKGLELVLVELPKFTPAAWTGTDKRMAVLWLRFLKEVRDSGRQHLQVSDDLLKDKKVRKALDICEEGKFTPEEMALYEREWMRISNEKAMLGASFEEGEAKGIAKGRQEGIRATAQKLKALGIPLAKISAATGLAPEEIEKLCNQL
jgi:predicted transposase/invertase (TIGR01784 family)